MSWGRKVARRVAVMNHARNLARSGCYNGWEAILADMQAVSDLSDAEVWFNPHFPDDRDSECPDLPILVNGSAG